MLLVPMTLREANDFVQSFHRHNGRTQRDGGKFALGCEHDGALVGVAIVGRPVARMLDDGVTAEVTRCCVLEGAPKGACSWLYGRCWRAWRALGGKRMVTYTLKAESGASLRGAGWKIMGETTARKEGQAWTAKGRDRDWQPIYGQQKFRWEVAVDASPPNGHLVSP